MKRVGLILLILLCGCATKVYIGPGTGVSAESQIVLSRSLSDAITDLDFSKFSGKKMKIQLFGMGGVLGAQPAQMLAYSLLIEHLLSSGVQVSNEQDAELLLALSIKVAGVDVTARDFPPVMPLIYHHTGFRGCVSLRSTVYDLKEMKILNTQDSTVEYYYIERYWFSLIGPYRYIERLPKSEKE
ncbi:MAG: hypothetical protein N2234_07605 [Planctomycetota bacterium]|nr:hypothetical protein [Planctomycetota bacterium]